MTLLKVFATAFAVVFTACGQLPSAGPYSGDPANNCFVAVALPGPTAVTVGLAKLTDACDGLTHDVLLKKMIPPTTTTPWVTFAPSVADGTGSLYLRMKVGDPVQVIQAKQGSYVAIAGLAMPPQPTPGGWTMPKVPAGYVHAEIPVFGIGQRLLSVQGTERAPFAAALHTSAITGEAQFVGQTYNPTIATFMQIDSDGKINVFQTIELAATNGDLRELSVSVPDSDAPAYVHLEDTVSLYSGDFQIYTPRRAPSTADRSFHGQRQ